MAALSRLCQEPAGANCQARGTGRVPSRGVPFSVKNKEWATSFWAWQLVLTGSLMLIIPTVCHLVYTFTLLHLQPSRGDMGLLEVLFYRERN